MPNPCVTRCGHHAVRLAREAGLAVEFIQRKHFRKEERITEPLARRGPHPGLVHVFSAMEPCPADRGLADLTADSKSRFSLSLADAFAAALAKLKKAELVTGDPEFNAVEKEIKIDWLDDRS